MYLGTCVRPRPIYRSTDVAKSRQLKFVIEISLHRIVVSITLLSSFDRNVVPSHLAYHLFISWLTRLSLYATDIARERCV